MRFRRGRATPTARLTALRWIIAITTVVLVLQIWGITSLRTLAAFLVIDQPLAPAAAIVVLAGETPARENEAARIYHDGWAPRIVIVGAASGGPNADLRQQTLLGLGVPEEAIVRVEGTASNTTEELSLAARAVRTGHEATILVSSKYHARRLLMTWNRVTAGRGQGIVRVARLDPFDPEHWWEVPSMRNLVLHEYLGILQLVATGLFPWTWAAPIG